MQRNIMISETDWVSILKWVKRISDFAKDILTYAKSKLIKRDYH